MVRHDTQNNFLLWGSWENRTIGHPFLTKRLRSDVKNVIVGPACMICLTQNGELHSWGKDNSGLLGQGDETEVMSPTKIEGFDSRVTGISKGSRHILALTASGDVYAWGANDQGQIGAGEDKLNVLQLTPAFVGIKEKVVQVVANNLSSYALTADGRVYSWGSNANFALGHGEKIDELKCHCEPTYVDVLNSYTRSADDMEDLNVRRIEAQGSVMLAYVDHGPKGEPGFDTANTKPFDLESGVSMQPAEEDTSIYSGVSQMREIMESLKRWSKVNDGLKHGRPYPRSDDVGIHDTSNTGGSLSFDMNASLTKLEEAAQTLELGVQSVQKELARLRQHSGSRNMQFLLEMYLDDCSLRWEKVQGMLIARKLVLAKRDADKVSGQMVCNFERGRHEIIQKITGVNSALQSARQEVSKISFIDVLTKELQRSVLQSIDDRLERNDLQIELAKASGDMPVDVTLPALRIIKETWQNLKAFSLFEMYQQYEKKKSDFPDDAAFLRFLVNIADLQIDQVVETDKDKLLSRDSLVPSLCYDLLLENAELRKMANAYQLRVLLLHKGSSK
eukprot:GEMP01019879.1.p1 GENE.GEMP01019879.1~~GEMP01019879.1.p1  ORF type:complete len:562 (+),score=130.93 GEMP01019879.1:100-1785(+)